MSFYTIFSGYATGDNAIACKQYQNQIVARFLACAQLCTVFPSCVCTVYAVTRE